MSSYFVYKYDMHKAQV